MYVWSLTLGGVEVDKGEVADHGLEATLEKLLPAETYEFSVKAKSSKNKVKLVSFFKICRVFMGNLYFLTLDCDFLRF